MKPPLTVSSLSIYEMGLKASQVLIWKINNIGNVNKLKINEVEFNGRIMKPKDKVTTIRNRLE